MAAMAVVHARGRRGGYAVQARLPQPAGRARRRAQQPRRLAVAAPAARPRAGPRRRRHRRIGGRCPGVAADVDLRAVAQRPAQSDGSRRPRRASAARRECGPTSGSSRPTPAPRPPTACSPRRGSRPVSTDAPARACPPTSAELRGGRRSAVTESSASPSSSPEASPSTASANTGSSRSSRRYHVVSPVRRSRRRPSTFSPPPLAPASARPPRIATSRAARPRRPPRATRPPRGSRPRAGESAPGVERRRPLGPQPPHDRVGLRRGADLEDLAAPTSPATVTCACAPTSTSHAADPQIATSRPEAGRHARLAAVQHREPQRAVRQALAQHDAAGAELHERDRHRLAPLIARRPHDARPLRDDVARRAPRRRTAHGGSRPTTAFADAGAEARPSRPPRQRARAPRAR